MRRSLLFLVLIPLLAFASETYTVQSLPNPKAEGQQFYVVNPDGVLSSETVAAINGHCAVLDDKVEVELCVVAIEQFDEMEYDAYGFALELFNTWGIGKGEKNTGVLVFLARGSRDIQIITGGGMEGLLPDAACSDIWHDAADKYLSDNDFDNGMLYIVEQIEERLLTTEAQSELLLGWKPEHPSSGKGLLMYLLLGFLLAIYLSYKMYKQGPITDEMSSEQWGKAEATLKANQKTMGWLGFVVWPIWVLYLFILLNKKQLLQHPIRCSKCGNKMYYVNDADAGQYLNDRQLKERSLQSRSFAVFKGAGCDHVEVISSKGAKAGQYSTCEACGGETNTLLKTKVLRKATYSSKGEKEQTYKCECCGHEMIKYVSIPILVKAVSSGGHGSSGYGSSRGGSSFSSGGSWGGGHSFGGGSGGKF